MIQATCYDLETCPPVHAFPFLCFIVPTSEISVHFLFYFFYFAKPLSLTEQDLFGMLRLAHGPYVWHPLFQTNFKLRKS